MNISDISGMKLGDALRILDEARIFVNKVEVTSPPKHKTDEYDNESRVIRIDRIGTEYVDLLVSCKKRYEES